MYATIPSQNSVAIINTNTLAIEDTVFVRSGPAKLAFSTRRFEGVHREQHIKLCTVID